MWSSPEPAQGTPSDTGLKQVVRIATDDGQFFDALAAHRLQHWLDPVRIEAHELLAPLIDIGPAQCIGGRIELDQCSAAGRGQLAWSGRQLMVGDTGSR